MNRLIVTLAVLLLALPGGANVLNPSFEDEAIWGRADHWNMTKPSSEWSNQNYVARTGARAAYCDPVGEEVAWMFNDALFPAGNYSIGVWAKGLAPLYHTMTLYLGWSDNYVTFPVSTSEWMLYETTLATAIPSNLHIGLKDGGDDAVYVDDVAVVAIPEPSGIAGLLAGLACLSRRLRCRAAP
jgi:hypothetical protein